MTRDPGRENAELRRRLREVEVRLGLLAGVVLAGDLPGAQALARALGTASMQVAGEPSAPPPPAGEPVARSLPTVRT